VPASNATDARKGPPCRRQSRRALKLVREGLSRREEGV
jgi:hypothetical protein